MKLLPVDSSARSELFQNVHALKLALRRLRAVTLWVFFVSERFCGRAQHREAACHMLYNEPEEK